MGARGHAARAVSLRLDHRRAEDPRHGDHPRARGGAARRLYRRHRPFRAGRRCAVQRRHPHRRASSRRRGEMGIGSGIVADSQASTPNSRNACSRPFLTKPIRLRADRDHALGAGQGFHLLERHLARLQSSAAHFGYPFDARRCWPRSTARTRMGRGPLACGYALCSRH